MLTATLSNGRSRDRTRVLLLSANYPDPVNNWAPWNREANLAISRIPGVTAEVVAPRPYTIPIPGLPHAELARVPRRVEGREGTVHYPRFLYPVPKRWFYAFAGATYSLSIGRYLRRTLTRPDLVHSHHVYPDGYGVLDYCREMDVPMVVDIHGDGFFAEWERPSMHARFEPVLAYASKIVCISRHIRDQALGIGLPDEKLEYVPLGVDVERFQKTVEADAWTDEMRDRVGDRRGVLFVGGLLEQKGIHHLLQAISQLDQDLRSEHVFIIVGEGPYGGALVGLARSLGVSDAVIFPGRIDGDRLVWLYQYCDTFVLPSLSEGKPSVINEAMASGCAVIASEISGIPEQVDHGVNGYLVPPGDSGAIAGRLELLLSDRARLERMKDAGTKKIADDGITWQRYGERIGAIYADVLEMGRWPI